MWPGELSHFQWSIRVYPEGRIYSSANEFLAHINACTNNRSFVCDICGMGFFTKSKLTGHRRVHTKEAEQKRLLFRLNNRAMSEAKRINPRNFPCDKCEMSYTTNQKLKAGPFILITKGYESMVNFMI